jgi:Cu/Zn superoxide dismutase
MGIINNLTSRIPSHGLHILEYSDILLLNKTNFENKNYNKYIFKHYNPYHTKHSCPSNEKDDEYHLGDLGNIIADHNGQAKFSIRKIINSKALSGRVIIVNKRKDRCKAENEFDDVNDIYALGVLASY